MINAIKEFFNEINTVVESLNAVAMLQDLSTLGMF